MKNKGFIYILVIIIIAGIAITMSTSRAIDKSREQSMTYTAAAQAAPETMMETEKAAVAAEPPAAAADAGQGSTVLTYDGEAAALAEAGPGVRMAGAEELQAAGPGARAAEEENFPNAGPGVNGLAAAEETAVNTSMQGPGVEKTEPGAEAEALYSDSATSGKVGPEQEKAAVSGASAKEGKTVPLSPLEPAMPLEKNAEGTDAKSGTEYVLVEVAESSYYLKRLKELDVQIQKNREKQSTSNNYSAKKAAENELKLWDNELNVIYGEIMERLSTSEASNLVDEEREWMKERDRLAAEAAKASAGGTMESVEYTISLAESTRLRTYELIETYGYLLEE